MTEKKKKPRRSPTNNEPVLSQDLIDEMCVIVEAGNFRYTAVQQLGLSPKSFANWVVRGNKHRRKMAKDPNLKHIMPSRMVTALDMAEGEAHTEMLKNVLESKDPKVVLQFLKMRYGKLYNNNATAIDDETGTEEKVDAATILADRLASFIAPTGPEPETDEDGDDDS